MSTLQSGISFWLSAGCLRVQHRPYQPPGKHTLPTGAVLPWSWKRLFYTPYHFVLLSGSRSRRLQISLENYFHSPEVRSPEANYYICAAALALPSPYTVAFEISAIIALTNGSSVNSWLIDVTVVPKYLIDVHTSRYINLYDS